MLNKKVRFGVCFICVMMLLVGCTPANNALKLLKSDAKANKGAIWLNDHYSEKMADKLLIMLNSPIEKRAQAAQAAFFKLGQKGCDYLFEHVYGMTTQQRQYAVEVLGTDTSNKGVLRLLSLYSFANIAEKIPPMVTSMGADVAPLLFNCLSDPQISLGARACFMGLKSDDVLPTLIEELSSESPARADIAEEMISKMGPEVVSHLCAYVLEQNAPSARVQQFIKNHPEECVEAIAAFVSPDSQGTQRQAQMLADYGDEYIVRTFQGMVFSSDSEKRDELAGLYADIIGVDKCLASLTNMEDRDSSAFVLIANTVSAKVSDEELTQYLLQTGDMEFIRNAAGNLLSSSAANVLTTVASGDAAAFGKLLESWEPEEAQWLGDQFKTTNNAETLKLVESMLPKANEPGYTNSLYMMAAIGGERFPSKVLDVLLNGSEEDAVKAMTAMVDIAGSNKFDYDGVDYMKYCDKICTFLSSENKEAAVLAQNMIQRIPESDENREFFVRIFELNPSRASFESLAKQFGTPDEEGITLKFQDGTTKTVTSVKLNINPSWKIIPSEDQPDLRKRFTEILKALGLSVSDSAKDVMEITFECTPLSKHYTHMIGQSYTGSSATYKLAFTSSDGKKLEYSGDYTIPCPDTIDAPADSPTYIPDPIDGPNQRCVRTGVCQGLGTMFGTDGLLRMYSSYPDFIEPMLAELFNEKQTEETPTTPMFLNE